jgi:dTDP-4-amino-4,6-dideoxygalactose transaminase
MQIPLLDLKAQYRAIKSEIDRAVAEVFESQHFILGPKVQQCEEKLSQYCRCPHAIGVSSGTDALLMALMAEGIGPDDEVITPPYSSWCDLERSRCLWMLTRPRSTFALS